MLIEAWRDLDDFLTSCQLPDAAGTTEHELHEFLDRQSLPGQGTDPIAEMLHALSEDEAQQSLLTAEEYRAILAEAWLDDVLRLADDPAAYTAAMEQYLHDVEEMESGQSLLPMHEQAERLEQMSLMTDRQLDELQRKTADMEVHRQAELTAGQSLMTDAQLVGLTDSERTEEPGDDEKVSQAEDQEQPGDDDQISHTKDHEQLSDGNQAHQKADDRDNSEELETGSPAGAANPVLMSLPDDVEHRAVDVSNDSTDAPTMDLPDDDEQTTSAIGMPTEAAETSGEDEPSMCFPDDDTPMSLPDDGEEEVSEDSLGEGSDELQSTMVDQEGSVAEGSQGVDPGGL